MPRIFIPILLSLFSIATLAQPSDFIVLKKKNNRTLKTYFPGSFISAANYSGFNLNGIIKHIRNDSVFIEQQVVRQVGTQFGVPALDTVVYTIGLHYQEIMVFYYTSDKASDGVGKRKRSGRMLQSLMIAGGVGFIIIEFVNTLYRGDSFSEGNTLTVMAIAAGVAATGFLWKHLQKRDTKSGKKYKVVYVHMGAKKAF